MNRTRQYYSSLLAALLFLFLGNGVARADLSSYSFGASTGSGYDMSSATQLLGPDNDDEGAVANIGFTFYLEGVPYTQFSVTSNGLMGLGSTQVSTCWENRLTATSGGCFGGYSYTFGSGIPQIAAFWDDMYTASINGNGDPFDGGIYYAVSGTAPHRVLVVEYRNMLIDYFNYDFSTGAFPYGTWQVRLYEGSNKIEFWYQHLDPDATGDASTVDGYPGASIGIATSPTDFVSLTPDSFGDATVSSSTANDQYVVANNPIPDNTLFTFNPCTIQITGLTAQGGTTVMASGDTLLARMSVQRGNSQGYQPFSVSLDPSPCTIRTLSMSISGPYAADYQLSTATTAVTAGNTVSPSITFTPSGLGVRRATLLVTDDNGFSRSYVLAGSGSTRIAWSGTVSQGGTAQANNGDTLLGNVFVLRFDTQSFTPITVQNFNSNNSIPGAPVTYTIIDPTGQFSVSPSSVVLGANQSSSPVITFHATGVSYQDATLIVTADGETRTYPLHAFSAAPGGDFFVGGTKLGPSSSLMVNYVGCVGENVNTQAMTVRNTGYGDFIINHVDFFLTDTAYGQGANYALLRDANGNAIPSYDYFITAQPGVAPSSANPPMTLPLVVPQGQTITLYFNYVGDRPGKRYARAFIRTNGQNFDGTDTNMVGGSILPTITSGLLTFDLFAQGVGSSISDNVNGGLPKTIVFPVTPVGASSFVSFPLFNAGLCNLRFSQKGLMIGAGDVNEFKILGGFETVQVDPSSGDYILTPGASVTVRAQFTPTQIGSRRATLILKSNDSTVYMNGVAERGTFYLDLYGQGEPNLNGTKIVLGTGAIGMDTIATVVDVVNPFSRPIVVTSVQIKGMDASDFYTNGNPSEASLPVTLGPGQDLKFGLSFVPTGGAPGARDAWIEVVTADGDTIRITLDATAGTRSLLVSPTALSFLPISVGKTARQMITVTNSGTMPVALAGSPTLGGANAADFSLSAFPRLVMAPGETDMLEITYTPTVAGSSSATVSFAGDAAGGTQVVTVTATASKTRLVLDPGTVIHVNLAGVNADQPVAQTVTVRNEGSEGVRVSDISFSGTDAGQFRVQQGPSEVAGNSEQTLTVEVLPNGHDLSAQLLVQAVNEVTGEQVLRVAPVEADQQKTSGVALAPTTGSGLMLEQSVPNPTKGEATISYRLNTSGDVSLVLFDVNGVLVRQMESGYREAGEHDVHIDLSGLPNGQYVYRLIANGVSLSRALSIVK